MKISMLMTKAPYTCRSTDFLDVAAKLMWDHDIGSVPVVNERGRVVGMLTDRDIAMAGFHQAQPPSAIPVAQTMAQHVISCMPDDEVAGVEALMAKHQIRRLPVIDEHGVPIGLISLNDIARKVGMSSVSSTDVARTLAAVSAPRELVLS
jgi:CBS domain-containing protein